jgi:hypothetical protein
MVWTQESTSTGTNPGGRSTQTDAATAESAPLYGMTTSRGARYLLRNGLDYLGYQQYERSLKFLREAETRKKELNDAEKLALRLGIERAQRGLREAADAQSPYALSERSRHRNGFSPANPETWVTAGTSQVTLPTRKTKTSQTGQLSSMGSDVEDQGEPVRLVSGETPGDAISRYTNNIRSPQTIQPDLNPAGPIPKIPKLLAASQLMEVSESTSSSERHLPTDDPSTAVTAEFDSPGILPPLVPAAESMHPTEGTVPQLSKRRIGLDGSGSQQSLSGKAMATKVKADRRANLVSAMLPPPEEGVGLEQSRAQILATGMLVSPVPPPSARTPSTESTASYVPQVTGAPTSEKIVQPPSTSRPFHASPNPAAINVATIDSSMQVESTTQRANRYTLAHTEKETAGPLSIPDPNRCYTAVSNAATIRPTGVAASNDELPPLPADIARPASPTAALDSEPTSPRASNSPLALPGDADEFPTLPPVDKDRPVSPKLTLDEPATSSAVSTPLLTSPNLAPNVSRTPTAATDPPAATTESVYNLPPFQIDEDTLLPLTTGNDGQSLPNSVPKSSRNVDSGFSAMPLQTVSGEVSVLHTDSTRSPKLNSAQNEIKLRKLVNQSSAATTAQSRQLYPTTNHNLAPVTVSATGPSSGLGVVSDAFSGPPAIEDREPVGSKSESFVPGHSTSQSILGPDLRREVEMMVRSQESEARSQRHNERQPAGTPVDTSASDPRTQFQLDTSRAPSPAEARPIRAIPVPEDWVPLAPRNWSPQRKYWAAAATCHLPLYFQDPVLERYGHSIEQFVGPIGQYLTYPVDDPMQSAQRNQVLQPFFSAGLFGLQIIAWPYNLIVDPPWEAQYDLGYYRPGDNIPTDTYWLPLHGYGPPLHGSRY